MISAGTYSNIIRPLMPLVITDEQLERGFPSLKKDSRNSTMKWVFGNQRQKCRYCNHKQLGIAQTAEGLS